MKTRSNLCAARRVIILTGTILALLIPNIAALGDEITEAGLNTQPVISTPAETPIQPEPSTVTMSQPGDVAKTTQGSSIQPKEPAQMQPASTAPAAVATASPETKTLTVAFTAPKKKVKAAVKAKPAASHKRVAKKSTIKTAARKNYVEEQPKPVVAVETPPIVALEPESGNIFSRVIEKAKSMVSNAFTWLGTRYVWGGTSRRGIDCSGLTRELYAKMGIKLPHSARLQAKMGQKIAGNALKPGDLVFFNTNRGPNTHVGVYIGNGEFLHAANPRRGVRVDKLSSAYYSKRLAGARRYS